MTLKFSLPLLEVRSQAAGQIEGYASVFGGVDSYGDSIAPGAFAASLSRHKAANTAPIMLWSHATDAPIGRWTKLGEDSRGLRVEGKLNLKTTSGKEAFEHLHAGDLNGLSIGFRVPEGGKDFRDGITVLKAIDLVEISVVAVPADSAARITSVKTLPFSRPETLRDFERALGSLGFTRSEASAIAARGFAGVSDESTELYAAFQAATFSFTV